MAGLNPIYLAHSTSYHNSFLIPQDSALDGAVKNSQDNGLPNIAVSPALGKFLNLVVKTIQGQRVLEVGTLGGYSTIWLARDHKLSPELFVEAIEQVARQNLEHAGVANKVTVIVGPAAETLATLRPEQPYDLVFIDADKASSLIYFNEGKRLLRKGGVIIVDNMVRNGRVADLSISDKDLEGVRQLLKAIKDDHEVEATTITTVGDRGFDGFLYAIKN